MRTTLHCNDDALFRHAEGTPATAELEAHIAMCARCTEELAGLRKITRALGAAEVWTDEAPSAAAGTDFAEIAALSRRMTLEDNEACQICDDILTGPAAWWETRFRNHGYQPSAGVVRQLLERMRQLLAKSPSQALAVTSLAIEIAGALTTPPYPRSFLSTLRGQVLRDHAFVLGFLGRFPEALQACDLSGRLFLSTAVPDFEMARLDLVRASIYRSIDRVGEAILLTRTSAQTFRDYGDEGRYVEARVTEAAYLFQDGAVVSALKLWQSVADHPAITSDLTRIGIIHNIGLCYRELGDLDEATHRFRTAMKEFERRGIETERVRSLWMLATTLIAAERTGEGIGLLRMALKEFDKLAMERDAALVSLDLAEALLQAGSSDEVPILCRRVLDRFADVSITSCALPALALLREALAAGDPTPNDVRRVREMLRPLASEPFRVVASRS
jgi:tetratricopeptide (TPR) repeat protein